LKVIAQITDGGMNHIRLVSKALDISSLTVSRAWSSLRLAACRQLNDLASCSLGSLLIHEILFESVDILELQLGVDLLAGTCRQY
jgi:hypothetical protein